MRYLLFLLFFTFYANTYAANVFETVNSCVRLSEILPVKSDKEIICNLNYGEEKKISGSKILNLLSREKINYKNLTIKDIYVKRTGIKLSESIIKNKIIKIYRKTYPKVRFNITKLKLADEIYVNKQKEFKISLKNHNFGSSYGIIDNGVKTKRFYFHIEAYKKIYVTSAKIRKGDELDNVILKEINITNLRYKPVEKLRQFIAKRNIPPNRPLTMDYVIKRPVNFEGDIVDLIYKSKNIYIETKGILEKNAYINDRVRIKNIDSGKTVYAKAVKQDKYIVIN